MKRAGTQAMRVALVIEMLRAATTVELRRPRMISGGTLAAAVRFIDLVPVPGMMKALTASGATAPVGLAERILRYVIENKLATVNRRELSRGHRGLFPDGPALRQAFDNLVMAGVLRCLTRSIRACVLRSRSGVFRPAEMFDQSSVFERVTSE
ncbi:hypothetical protein [Bosea sp. CRIB-10]|uniref:hypothetical protein n=1 Tax=Bosea sp. CRIB-10 TaxID=378404 RepID=UPI0011140618|nr:hypothetical protein [Bosea sp. CRIB-10]